MKAETYVVTGLVYITTVRVVMKTVVVRFFGDKRVCVLSEMEVPFSFVDLRDS